VPPARGGLDPAVEDDWLPTSVRAWLRSDGAFALPGPVRTAKLGVVGCRALAETGCLSAVPQTCAPSRQNQTNLTRLPLDCVHSPASLAGGRRLQRDFDRHNRAVRSA
jgi:hypothetical protein